MVQWALLDPLSKDHQKIQYAACMPLLKRVVRHFAHKKCICTSRNWKHLWLRSVSLGIPRARQRAISRSNIFCKFLHLSGIAKGAGRRYAMSYDASNSRHLTQLSCSQFLMNVKLWYTNCALCTGKDWRLKKKITTKIEELKVGDWRGFPGPSLPNTWCFESWTLRPSDLRMLDTLFVMYPAVGVDVLPLCIFVVSWGSLRKTMPWRTQPSRED